MLEQNPPKSGRFEVRDSESPLVFRITSAGARSFTVRTRIGKDAEGQVRLTYPNSATIENLSDAQIWARKAVDEAKAGVDPRLAMISEAKRAELAAEKTERLKIEKIVENYADRRLRKQKQNRTADDAERTLQIYVVGRWRGRLITEITRADVNALLDDVFDRKVRYEGKTFGGPVAADNLLAQIRACFNWWATQDDTYTSPIVKGMARTSAKARRRKRVLTDDEIRALWKCCGELGVSGALVKVLFLSAQRREEIAGLKRSVIDNDGVATILDTVAKNKTENRVPLPKAALKIIDAQDRINGSDLIFTLNGKTAFSGYSKLKRRLDTAMLAELRHMATERGEDPEAVTLPHWTLHDLRRTAKTRMQKAGVRPDISERVLNHVIEGVEGVYDHYDYLPEKRDALDRLTTAIDRIVNPPAANVVQLGERAAQ